MAQRGQLALEAIDPGSRRSTSEPPAGPAVKPAAGRQPRAQATDRAAHDPDLLHVRIEAGERARRASDALSSSIRRTPRPQSDFGTRLPSESSVRRDRRRRVDRHRRQYYARSSGARPRAGRSAHERDARGSRRPARRAARSSAALPARPSGAVQRKLLDWYDRNGVRCVEATATVPHPRVRDHAPADAVDRVCRSITSGSRSTRRSSAGGAPKRRSRGPGTRSATTSVPPAAGDRARDRGTVRRDLRRTKRRSVRSRDRRLHAARSAASRSASARRSSTPTLRACCCASSAATAADDARGEAPLWAVSEVLVPARRALTSTRPDGFRAVVCPRAGPVSRLPDGAICRAFRWCRKEAGRPMSPPVIVVVAAVIEEDGRLLVTAASAAPPEAAGVPGGKREPGETNEQASGARSSRTRGWRRDPREVFVSSHCTRTAVSSCILPLRARGHPPAARAGAAMVRPAICWRYRFHRPTPSSSAFLLS